MAEAAKLDTVRSPSKNFSRQLCADLDTLEAAFKVNKNIKALVFSCYDRASNPYSYALDLMINATEFNRSKGSSVSYAVIAALREYAQRKKTLSPPTLDVKRKALELVMRQKNMSLLQVVIVNFKIQEDSIHFMETIEDLLMQNKLNEAFYCVTALNLQEKFSLDQIVLPLIFQDKRELAIEYVKDCHEMQLELITVLDSVCTSREAMLQLAGTLKIDVKKGRLDTKWLQKVLWNILKKLDLQLDCCPNLHRCKSTGALKYLMFKRYIEQSISEDSFIEMIVDNVQTDSILKREALIYLISYNDWGTALKIARILNVPEQEWPETLREYAVDGIEALDVGDQEIWDEGFNAPPQPGDHLSLEISRNDIHLVETVEQFVNCITDISENYCVVGIDAEWKPSLGRMAERLSLLQLGMLGKIYLIDFFVLSSKLQDEHFILLMEKFLGNKDILKLGYAISHDLKVLMRLYKGKTKCQYSSVLDVGIFYNECLAKYPEMSIMADGSTVELLDNESVKGLSKLCQVTLGKPLLKTEQFSDWEKRPLREDQLLYAALDAQCLLKIFESVCNMLHKNGHNSTSEVKDFLQGNGKLSTVNKRNKRKSQKKPVKSEEEASCSTAMPKSTIPINQFRAVADNMLQGCGKYLRVCGADVVILENDDDHLAAAKIALEEERFVLSSGAALQQLKSHVRSDMCLNVPRDVEARTQAQFVIQQLNLKVADEDVFSRCSICNGAKWVHIPSEMLLPLWLASQQSASQTTSGYNNQGTVPQDKYSSQMQPGVSMQLEKLSSNVVKRVKDFKVCSKCGKVYWEGSHHRKIKTYLIDFLPHW